MPLDYPDLSKARERISLRVFVIDELRTNIIDGVFEPGQKLVERELCERYGVSRTLIREALQSLQAEGLIVNVLHRGPSVATISEHEAREIYQVRELLESQAGRDFVANAGDREIDRLEAVVEALRDPSVEQDPRRQLEIKNDFYSILLTGAGNSTIEGILRILNNRVTILRRRSLANPGRLEESRNELAAIAAAARVRDADKVASLCGAHIRRAAELALASFEGAAVVG